MSSQEPDPKSSPADAAEQAAETPTRASKEPQRDERPDPTRYGDWEKGGRCIDF